MIPNWLLQRAYVTPNRIALTFEGQQWTFQQLKEESLQLAGKMKRSGLRDGDRIALLGRNTASMVVTIHACLLVGVEIVLLNNRLAAKELQWQIDDSEVTRVIVDDTYHDKVKASTVPVTLFSELAQLSVQLFEPLTTWEDNRTLTIMYTSGTTGLPKGVRQTVENHVSSAISSVLNLGLCEDDVWLCAMPLFHISGFSILARSVIYGMTVRLYEKFDATESAREISQGTVTRMSVVSQTLHRILLELESSQLTAHPKFKSMLVGGGSVPVAYLERAVQCQIPISQTYGMTETSSQTATLSPTEALTKMGSAGKPLFFNQIHIHDANEPFEIGEVYIRGPHVTPGYIGHAANKNPLIDGWLPSGDIGYVDDEGYLYIVDRRSDLIISGGENIYPAEIENTLLRHPAIREAGVCGIDDDEWGQVPIAFIVTDEEVDFDILRFYCEEHLARYKVPKQFYRVASLPRNASNKLLRRELKQLLEENNIN